MIEAIDTAFAISPTRRVGLGVVEYRLTDNRLHRTDGPALIADNDYEVWAIFGRAHRNPARGYAVSPSWIEGDGIAFYAVNGELFPEGNKEQALKAYQEWSERGEVFDGPIMKS